MRVMGATPIRFLNVNLFNWNGVKRMLSLMINLLMSHKNLLNFGLTIDLFWGRATVVDYNNNLIERKQNEESQLLFNISAHNM